MLRTRMAFTFLIFGCYLILELIVVIICTNRTNVFILKEKVFPAAAADDLLLTQFAVMQLQILVLFSLKYLKPLWCQDQPPDKQRGRAGGEALC